MTGMLVDAGTASVIVAAGACALRGGLLHVPWHGVLSIVQTWCVLVACAFVPAFLQSDTREWRWPCNPRTQPLTGLGGPPRNSWPRYRRHLTPARHT